jgi:hypothetical protein
MTRTILSSTSFSFAVAIALALSACSSERTPAATTATTASPAIPAPTATTASVATPAAGAPSYADFVGTWHFVYTDARRAAVEADLATKITDPVKLAEAKKGAEAESAASEIELTAGQHFLSRVQGEQLLDAAFTYQIDGAGTLELTSPTRPDMKMHMTLRDPNTLVVMDPRKGELVFSR